MAAKSQAFDVWVVEKNTVYRAVPFSVVTDWVQQGRLLDEDRLRPEGGGPWTRLAEMPAMAPYVPQPVPHRADDTAEALEPVHTGFTWKPGRGETDEDVDMIPLIDVSLVLLVFFMMTAAVGGAGALIDTPKAEHRLLSAEPQMWWVGIARLANGSPEYSFGRGNSPAQESPGSDPRAVVAALAGKLPPAEAASVRIRADQHLPIEVVREITRLLESLQAEGKVGQVMGEVSENTP